MRVRLIELIMRSACLYIYDFRGDAISFNVMHALTVLMLHIEAIIDIAVCHVISIISCIQVRSFLIMLTKINGLC